MFVREYSGKSHIACASPLSLRHLLGGYLHRTSTSSATMSSPVKLYVYDLSNGMARRLSLQLTGRQIDGIWFVSQAVRLSGSVLIVHAQAQAHVRRRLWKGDILRTRDQHHATRQVSCTSMRAGRSAVVVLTAGDSMDHHFRSSIWGRLR